MVFSLKKSIDREIHAKGILHCEKWINNLFHTVIMDVDKCGLIWINIFMKKKPMVSLPVNQTSTRLKGNRGVRPFEVHAYPPNVALFTYNPTCITVSLFVSILLFMLIYANLVNFEVYLKVPVS